LAQLRPSIKARAVEHKQAGELGPTRLNEPWRLTGGA
jgi:hypothetical protein